MNRKHSTNSEIKMASKKKRVEDVVDMEAEIDDDSGNGNEDLDDSDMEEEVDSDTPLNEEIQVEFEARMFDDSDFHGIKTLLQQVFLKSNVNLTELTNTLISQNHIGSAVKQSDVPDDEDDDMDDDDDDSVFGIISVVNITEKKMGILQYSWCESVLSVNAPHKLLLEVGAKSYTQDLDCVKQIKSMLVDRCKACGQEKVAGLNAVLNSTDKHTGLLFSERYLNIPAQISVPMYDSLWKDMEKCTRKGMQYKFGQFVMISKTYRMKGEGKVADQLFFSNSEEELIHEACDMTFSYSVQDERDTVVDGKWDSEDHMEAMRTVIVISAEKLLSAVTKIKTELAST